MGKITEGMFSSNSDEWETPQWLFDELNERYAFTLDLAATLENRKCEIFDTDLLPNDPKGYAGESCFMNPPYSKIKDFMRKAYNISEYADCVVVLIPSRTDTRYWHDYVMKASRIEFIKGRLKFSESKQGAPFPSAIVIFLKEDHNSCIYPLISTFEGGR